MTNDSFLWCESYSPKNVEECILPKSLKTTFQEFASKGKIPNLILSGSPGVGKTSTAKALCAQVGADVMFMNASSERGIDDVRNKMFSFASTTSLTQNRKVLILDEADNLTGDAQKALRAAIEELQNNCAFVLTCNYKNKLIPALHSRCAVIDFTIPKAEKPKLAKELFTKVCKILDENLIGYDPKVIAKFVQVHFPDFRRTINELQRHSQGGKVDTNLFTTIGNVNLKDLIVAMKGKKYQDVRKWVVNNLDNDFVTIAHQLYVELHDVLEPSSIPQAVVSIAEYSYKSAFAIDMEINLLAMLVEIMTLDFK